MTSRDFVYWLQGFFELRDSDAAITPKQADLIKRHLALVFIHEIDPSAPAAQQAALNAAHAGPTLVQLEAMALAKKKPKPPSGGGGGFGGEGPGGQVYRC